MQELTKSIICNNICKKYNHSRIFSDCRSTIALANITFSVSHGEILGIIGKNGAGKTTLIKILSGIMVPDSGEVEVMGTNPFKRIKSYRNSVAIIMGQKSQMDEDISIYDNALFMASIYGINRETADIRISSLSSKLGLTTQLKQQVRTLSLGERMKGDLLIAFLHTPTIIFLDEPTIGLDYSTQCSVRSFLKEYVKQNNASLILTSHNIDDIKELSDNILILNEGKQLFLGTISELYMIVKPKKFLEFKMDDETIKQVEIQQDNQKFIETIGKIPSDRLKEINLVDMDLNEVIEELYRRSK